MRTYSKRRNRPQDNNLVVDGQTDRKRRYHSETEGRPRKRRKSVDQPAMSGTFETPHPTLEANSQVYKLPSTKPIPSPTPFSPVPNTAPTHSLDLRPRSYFVPTTSGSLKENAGSSKSIRRRQSSKTLSSFTLTSGSGPPSPNTRENGKQTRSPSQSPNSASSRSRSRDQTSLSQFKAKLIKKSKIKSNATINDLGEHHPSKPLSRSKPFPKRSKSILLISNTEKTLLASPFASRAPSPADRSNPGIAKSGLNESMGPPLADPTQTRTLSDVYVDLVPSHSHTRNQSKKSWLLPACGALSSPGTRKRSSASLLNRGRGSTNENDFSWKNRRPSAPSTLQRPLKPVGKAHTPAKRAAKPGHKQFKEEDEIKHRKPALSHSFDPIKDRDNQLSVELNGNSNPFLWMQERSAVDFNRPPSQLSFRLSSGFIHAKDDAEAEGVFWSSGEDNDGINDQNQRPGANLEVTNPAWLTSTPYKKVKRLSVPILEVPSMTLPKSLGSMDTSAKISIVVGNYDKSGGDMELTAPLEFGDNPECPRKYSMSFQEHTPWTSDSIISPPTAYLERIKPAVNVQKVVDENVGKEEQLVPTEPGLKMSMPSSSMMRTQTGAWSSPYRSSYAESTSSVLESSSGLHELAVGNQEHKKEDSVTYGTEDKGGFQPQGPPYRTRSGTILAARNGLGIARRTRSGTIVGPSTIGRTRSGTIIAKVKVPQQTIAVVGNRRIRSGSIVTPVPDLSGTGSVTEPEPTNISGAAGAEEEVHVMLDGELIQIENTCDPYGSAIKEVNAAECYVDSLYLSSSPDPIDFLSGPKIDGDESGLVVAVGEWQVADEPPSPETRRTKKNIQTPRGVGRLTSRRFRKGHRKNRTRFLAADGQVEGYETDPKGNNLEDGSNDTSDDELLLVDGQSQSPFG